MLLLVLAYLAFLLPVVAVGWGLWTPWHATFISNQVKAVLASVYWWMYGVNFIIYLTSNNRIRAAYVRLVIYLLYLQEILSSLVDYGHIDISSVYAGS